MSRILLAAALGAATLAGAPMARAHAMIEPASAPADSAVELALSVSHGCDGQATTALEAQIPDGLIDVQAPPKPGWTIGLAEGAYARTHTLHGHAISRGVTQIRWSGGEVPDHAHETFAVRAHVADLPEGTELAIVVRQICATATVMWDEVAAAGQDAHALAHPAPVLRVGAAGAAGAHAHGQVMDHGKMPPQMHGAGATASARLGDLTIDGAFVRAAAAGGASAAYLTVTSSGAPDRLTGAASPAARRVELHAHQVDAHGVAKMRPVAAIEVTPGSPAVLEEGGLHVMMMGIVDPLVEGDSIALTLRFEHAGEVTFDVPVQPATGGHKHADQPAK